MVQGLEEKDDLGAVAYSYTEILSPLPNVDLLLGVSSVENKFMLTFPRLSSVLFHSMQLMFFQQHCALWAGRERIMPGSLVH